jgi:hypothetical protein
MGRLKRGDQALLQEKKKKRKKLKGKNGKTKIKTKTKQNRIKPKLKRQIQSKRWDGHGRIRRVGQRGAR